jgi:hypothetical protein
MQALRSGLARSNVVNRCSPPLHKLASSLRARAPVRAMAAASGSAPDGTKLDKGTPEAVWRGLLTPEEVSESCRSAPHRRPRRPAAARR